MNAGHNLIPSYIAGNGRNLQNNEDVSHLFHTAGDDHDKNVPFEHNPRFEYKDPAV